MKRNKAILDYDHKDTTAFIDPKRPKTLKEIGITLPQEAPTKVVSIRIPTRLYNDIRAYSTNRDIPYQATMKMLLEKGIRKENTGRARKSRRVASNR